MLSVHSFSDSGRASLVIVVSFGAKRLAHPSVYLHPGSTPHMHTQPCCCSKILFACTALRCHASPAFPRAALLGGYISSSLPGALTAPPPLLRDSRLLSTRRHLWAPQRILSASKCFVTLSSCPLSPFSLRVMQSNMPRPQRQNGAYRQRSGQVTQHY